MTSSEPCPLTHELNREVHRLMSERSCSYLEALHAIRSKDPERFRAARQEMAPRTTRTALSWVQPNGPERHHLQRTDARLCGVVGEGAGGTTVVETRIAVSDRETLVNGGRRFKLTSAMLDEMIANYSAWRAEGGPPAAGYIGHARDGEQARRRASGEEPPALHVLSLWRFGDELRARLEFQPWAWARVFGDGERPLRGLSIVFSESGTDRHGKPQGATFFGVDVVADPLLPAEIAAAKVWLVGRDLPVEAFCLSSRLGFAG